MAQNASGDDSVEHAGASIEGADELAASAAEERAASEAADEFQSSAGPDPADAAADEAAHAASAEELAEADAGILFCPPDNVAAEFPQFPVTRDYGELRRAVLSASSA